MIDVGLLGVASYLPERVVSNAAFAPDTAARRGMFTAPAERRHVSADESAAEIGRASCRERVFRVV